VHAVAGIGHPARFFDALRAAGIEVIEHAFDDHHAFTPRDFAFTPQAPILMTEKDGVKCAAFGLRDAWQVPVQPEFEPAAWSKLLAQIDAQVRTAEAARSS
jgi:tetraacyldisaccharide 4'-kinase